MDASCVVVCDKHDAYHTHDTVLCTWCVFDTSRTWHITCSHTWRITYTHHVHHTSRTRHITYTTRHVHDTSRTRHITYTTHNVHDASRTRRFTYTTHHVRYTSRTRYIPYTTHHVHNTSRTRHITYTIHHVHDTSHTGYITVQDTSVSYVRIICDAPSMQWRHLRGAGGNRPSQDIQNNIYFTDFIDSMFNMYMHIKLWYL